MTMWRDTGIVGAGTLATAMGVLLKQAGCPVRILAGRSPQRSEAAAARVGCEWAIGASEAARRAPWILVVVPDDAVAAVASEIADAWRGHPPAEATVVHVSGVLGIDSLAPVADVGAAVGVAHPLQSVSDVESALAWLPRSTFGISGAGRGREMARAVAQACGARALEVADAARPLYHAGACVASNYLSVLLEVAAGLMARGTGMPPRECLDALLPLVEGTLANVARQGPVSALTGPVARGDAGTVRRHRDAMVGRQVPDSWQGIYRTLGMEALAVAQSRGLSAEAAESVRSALHEEIE